jgi:Protein of unknown function (DUF998)
MLSKEEAMGNSATARRATEGPAICDGAGRTTKSLLGYSVLAGPFYVLVVLVQAFTRPGFDLAHDDASLLSNGALGWVQIANFVITGLMVIAFAAGVRRTLHGGFAAAWGPRLLALFGLGLIGAGLFVADPMNGFPASTPAGHAAALSLHGALHIACAAIGFLGLVAACFVLGRRLSSEGRVQLAGFSRATGAIFLAGFVAIASGSSSGIVVGAFWLGLIVAWGWVGSLAVHLYRQIAPSVLVTGVSNRPAMAEITARPRCSSARSSGSTERRLPVSRCLPKS